MTDLTFCGNICKDLLSLQRNVADHHRLAGLLAPAAPAAPAALPDRGNLEVVSLGLFWHVLHVATTAARRYLSDCDIKQAFTNGRSRGTFNA